MAVRCTLLLRRASITGTTYRALSVSTRELARREHEARTCIGAVVQPHVATVRSVRASADGAVRADIGLRSGATPGREELRHEVIGALTGLDWAQAASCDFSLLVPQRLASAGPQSLSAVSHVIGVSSCKGGVGKSTVAVGLAYALARMGGRVGLLDADIHGPSLPTMIQLPADALPVVKSASTQLLLPPEVHGVKLMSLGFIAKGASTGTAGPAVVRGPVASSTVQQLAAGTAWGELDYLIVDMPPGTGDIALTLCQSVGLTSALAVSTPGRLAAADTLKGLQMLRDARVPLLAVVENLAYYVDPVGTRHDIFGSSHRRRLAEHAASTGGWAVGGMAERVASGAEEDASRGVFSLPIEPDITDAVEHAEPVVVRAPDSRAARTFDSLARHVVDVTARMRHADAEGPEATVHYRDADGMVVVRFLRGAREGREYALPAGKLRAHSMDARSEADRRAVADSASGDPAPAAAVGTAAVVTSVRASGNYGVSIEWGDGHAAAIYPFEQIAELAESECRHHDH